MRLKTAHKILKGLGYRFAGIADANYPSWRGLAYEYNTHHFVVFRKELKLSVVDFTAKYRNYIAEYNRSQLKIVHSRTEFTLSSPPRGNLRLVA